MVVYRATPAGVQSGVRVGDLTYPGYPLSGAGVGRRSGALRGVLRAALRPGPEHADQHLRERRCGQPGHGAARCEGVRPKTFRRSRIEVSPQFLQRVVPAILENTPDLQSAGSERPGRIVSRHQSRPAQAERRDHRRLRGASPRRRCSGRAHSCSSETRRSRRCSPTTARTSTTARRSTSRCTSASISPSRAAMPVLAANDGRVVHADYLGIYGNCVIIDHGFGVQSLYGHLSSMDVKPGDTVHKGADDRPQRHDGPCRRRSPALHDARRRTSRELRRVVGPALDRGPRAAQGARGGTWGDASVYAHRERSGPAAAAARW